jgi:Kef-type K+ transport system membrane component KefB
VTGTVAAAAGGTSTVVPTTTTLALHFFIQLAIILVTCRVLTPLFRRIGQVQVVAIMVAGFVLGPSLLGALAPGAQRWLFPVTLNVGGQTIMHPSVAVLYVVGQLGLILYMFLVGTAFNRKVFASHVRTAAVTSLAGITLPILLGGALGVMMVRSGSGKLFTPDIAEWQAALFVAAAIAITAFPMLAWIIYDTGLLNTKIGTIALACAAADDAASWVLLATVIAFTNHRPLGAVEALVGGGAFVALMLTAGRRVLARLDTTPAAGGSPAADGQPDMASQQDAPGGPGPALPVSRFTVTILVVLGCAWFTDFIGVYSVFGAFIAGLAMPRGQFTSMLRERMEPLVAYVLLPAFFIYSGLNTNLSIFVNPALLGFFALTLVIAFAAKGGSVALAGHAQGLSWAEALSLGSLMNARGLIELILLNIGLAAHLVTTQLYTILALMTIVTTIAATPLHNAIQRRRPAHFTPGEPEPAHGEAAVLAGAGRPPRL